MLLPNVKLGEFIRDKRIERGMTQTDLANAVGVKQRTISAIERGERSADLDRRAEIAAVLNVRPIDLTMAAGDIVEAIEPAATLLSYEPEALLERAGIFVNAEDPVTF